MQVVSRAGRQIVARKAEMNPGPDTADLMRKLNSGRTDDVPVELLGTRRCAEFRALALQPNTAGGYTVAEDFAEEIELALLEASALRRASRVIRTPTGGPLPCPTSNDTTVEGELIPENFLGNAGDAVFGTVTLNAYKFHSKRLVIPTELLEDALPTFRASLAVMIGRRIGRIQNRKFTVGTGASEPMGAVTAATTGATAASPTAIAADDVLNLLYAVDPAYREGPSSVFMLHNSIGKILAELKDTAGRYLLELGRWGEPDTIRGFRVIYNPHMVTAPVSGARSILFGDFSRYTIRDVGELRLLIYGQAANLAEADQWAYAGHLRSDGNIIDAGTHPIMALQH
jgi:HK97 family phage major capsid protein